MSPKQFAKSTEIIGKPTAAKLFPVCNQYQQVLK